MPSPSILDPIDLRDEQEAIIRSEEADKRLNVQLLLTTLRRGLSTILLSVAVASGLGGLLAFRLPVTYTGTTSFLPPGSDLSGGASAASRLASMGGLGAGLLGSVKSSGDLYVALLKNPAVVRRVVNTFHLQSVYGTKTSIRAEKRLAGSTQITLGTKDPVIVVSVVDTSPQRAADLANGYVAALQQTTAQLSLTENADRRSFYEQRLQQEKTALADAEVELRKTQESTGILSPAGQTASGIQELAQLRAQLSARLVQLASLRHTETEESPNVQQVKAEVQSLQSQIVQSEKSQSGGPGGQPSTIQVPALQLEYVRKLREVKYHETLFDILSKQYEAARLDEAQDTPLQVIDRATVPEMKSGPPRMIIVAVSVMLGLFAGAAYVLLRGSGILRRG